MVTTAGDHWLYTFTKWPDNISTQAFLKIPKNSAFPNIKMLKWILTYCIKICLLAAHRSMAGEGQPSHSPATGIVQGLLGKGNILIHTGGEDNNSK